MLTSRGVGVLVAAVLVFLLAAVTGVGWLRIADAVLWGMLLLSPPIQWLSVSGLDARLRAVPVTSFPKEGLDRIPTSSPARPMVGDEIEMGLQLINPRFWRRFFVSAEVASAVEGDDAPAKRFFVAELKEKSTLTLKRRVQCQRRGIHRLGPVVIESKAPFGLFKRRRRVEASISVLVYPRVHPMSRFPMIDGRDGDSERPRRAQLGDQIAGARVYYPGDSLRLVHWRQTARLRRPMVREMEESSQSALTIAFDPGLATGPAGKEMLEYAIELATTVGAHLLGLGRSVNLAYGGLRGEWSAPEPFLRELATLQPVESLSSIDFPREMAPSSPVLAIVGGSADRFVDELMMTYRQGPAAVVLMHGFGEADGFEAGEEKLRAAGVPTVAAYRGELIEAVRDLERLASAPLEAAVPLS